MEPRPKTVLEEILEGRQEMGRLLSLSYELDEVAVARLKARINADLKVMGRPLSYLAGLHHELGCLLALQNRNGSDEQFDIAEKFGIDPIGLALSRSHSAIMAGRIVDSRVIVEDLIKADIPEEARRFLFIHLGQNGMLEAMIENEVAGERDVRHEQAASAIIRALDVNDVELTKRLDTACRVIRANIKHPILGRKLFAMEGECILFRYIVKAPTDELMAINNKILDALIDSHDGPLDQVLSILVTPWSEDDSFTTEAPYNVELN